MALCNLMLDFNDDDGPEELFENAPEGLYEKLYNPVTGRWSLPSGRPLPTRERMGSCQLRDVFARNVASAGMFRPGGQRAQRR